MQVNLRKAKQNECELIHQMQVISFKALLEKYQDYDLSPGNESVKRIVERFGHPLTDYHIIEYNGKDVGAIRMISNETASICRVGTLFVLPQYQGKGIAQSALKQVEEYYVTAERWLLDTIKEEAGNCYLYEKIGYLQTGKEEVINDRMTLVYYEKLKK